MKPVRVSLFSRNLWLLVFLFLAGLGSGALALREWVQKPRISLIAELLARQIRLAQAGLEALPPERRASMRPWLNARSGGAILVPVAEADPPALRGIEAMPLTRQLVNDLSMRLPGVVDEVRWNPQQRGTLWAKVSVAGVEYWFVERDVLPDADYPLTGLGVLAMTGALSLAGAIAIQRRINRPLSRLVEAASLIARGETPSPLSEREPREIATVASAFNRMTSSLAQLDAERAIVLAGVSHDLRTPLAKMRLAIEMLNRNGDTSLIDSMLRSTQEMDQITEQFLHFARAGGVEEMSCSDLNQIVRECAAKYEAAARAPILDLRELPSVRLHVPSIRRAIYNLIENAYRYGAGEVRLTSGCGNATVFVSVLDRGPGIAQSEIEAVRKPFVRGASSAGTGGAGLGLAIVERIIRLHGGRLELLARDGGGLEARIQLPRPAADPRPAPA